MNSSGIAGAVLAISNCAQCQHRWNCADRRTQEIVNAVAENPQQLRGLASYDPLRIGESLRWIGKRSVEGGLTGAYVQAECSIAGMDASRMYPLYGLCAMLRPPVVLEITSLEQWAHYRPQVEAVAADFPEMEIVLAPPQGTDADSIIELMQQLSAHLVSAVPTGIACGPVLCEYVELEGREHTLFRSSPDGWAADWRRPADCRWAWPRGAPTWVKTPCGYSSFRLRPQCWKREREGNNPAAFVPPMRLSPARQGPTFRVPPTCATGCSLLASNSLGCRPAKLVMGWDTTANRYF